MFAGDTFDIWRDVAAYVTYWNLVKPGDIFVPGNHDSFVEHPLASVTRAAVLTSGDKKFVVVHGDEVDFLYAPSIAAGGSEWWAKALRFFKKDWDLRDAYALYSAMCRAPGWVVDSLEHGSPRFIQWFKAVGIVVLLFLSRRDRFPREVGATHNGSALLRQHPHEQLRRIRALRPEVDGADTVIMGHFHAPADWSGAGRRLVTLGAWVEGSTPTIGLIEDGVLTIDHSVLSRNTV